MQSAWGHYMYKAVTMQNQRSIPWSLFFCKSLQPWPWCALHVAWHHVFHKHDIQACQYGSRAGFIRHNTAPWYHLGWVELFTAEPPDQLANHSESAPHPWPWTWAQQWWKQSPQRPFSLIHLVLSRTQSIETSVNFNLQNLKYMMGSLYKGQKKQVGVFPVIIGNPPASCHSWSRSAPNICTFSCIMHSQFHNHLKKKKKIWFPWPAISVRLRSWGN